MAYPRFFFTPQLVRKIERQPDELRLESVGVVFLRAVFLTARQLGGVGNGQVTLAAQGTLDLEVWREKMKFLGTHEE